MVSSQLRLVGVFRLADRTLSLHYADDCIVRSGRGESGGALCSGEDDRVFDGSKGSERPEGALVMAVMGRTSFMEPVR